MDSGLSGRALVSTSDNPAHVPCSSVVQEGHLMFERMSYFISNESSIMLSRVTVPWNIAGVFQTMFNASENFCSVMVEDLICVLMF